MSAPSAFKSYFYPTALILIVSGGSIYGATLKTQNQLEAIKEKIKEPHTRLRELEDYREQLIAQRMLHARRLHNWTQKALERESEGSKE